MSTGHPVTPGQFERMAHVILCKDYMTEGHIAWTYSKEKNIPEIRIIRQIELGRLAIHGI